MQVHPCCLQRHHWQGSPQLHFGASSYGASSSGSRTSSGCGPMSRVCAGVDGGGLGRARGGKAERLVVLRLLRVVPRCARASATELLVRAASCGMRVLAQRCQVWPRSITKIIAF